VIPNEILSGISPYGTEHLNRFGVFQLDMQKMMADIENDFVDSKICYLLARIGPGLHIELTNTLLS
jgi:hypothetical protein